MTPVSVGPRLTYGSYLRLDHLLGLQCPKSAPLVPDELLFITVHQVFELWLKLLLFELAGARDEMLAKRGTGDSAGATYLRSRLTQRFYPELWEMRTQL